MSRSEWRALRGVDRRRLSEARLQAHYAVQWLARSARAFVPPQPDDNHTNLGWDDALDGFTTHALKDDLRLGLRIADLTLALPSVQYPLNGRSDAQARQWLGEQLDGQGLDARALDLPSPYEMPEHAVATEAGYDTAGLADALADLAAWFANANSSLGRVTRQMIERKLAPSPVRCWPHHFDLASLISFPGRTGETAFVGVGLSPGDTHYDEPYFYVTIYPQPDTMTLPPLSLGHWHDHEFVGAIAPAHLIVMAHDPKAATDDFLQNAVDTAIDVLR
jgi:hypothetical protein